MSIGTICTHNVVVAGHELSIRDAAKRMQESQVGCMVILEDVEFFKKPIGILTDRDIVIRAVLSNMDLDTATIGDIMTTSLVTIKEQAPIQSSLEFMRLEKVRRAPVVNTEERLVGIITIEDVMDHIANELHDLSQLIKKR